MFRRNFSRLTRQRRKTSNILSDKYRKRVAEMPLFFILPMYGKAFRPVLTECASTDKNSLQVLNTGLWTIRC